MRRSTLCSVWAALVSVLACISTSMAQAAATDPVSSFGQNGVASLPSITYGSRQDVVVSFQTMMNGTSYALRLPVDSNGTPSYVVYRLTAAGVVDSSFAANGIKINNTTSSYLRYQGLLVDESKQRFYLTGRNSVGPSIDAYKFDGSMDASFGSSGHLSIESDEEAAAEYGSFDSSGRILVGMHSNNKPTTTIDTVEVARINSNGTLDASFGSGGVSRIQFASTADYANTYAPLELLPSGAIVVPFVKYSCTSAQTGSCSSTTVGSAYAKFPAVGYATTQSDGSTVKLIATGNNEPFALVNSGSDSFRALLSSYDDDTFKIFSIATDSTTTLSESVPATTFQFITDQSVGIFNDGSILIGGYGKATNPSSAPVAKLAGDFLLVPYVAPVSTQVPAASSGGGGAFGHLPLVFLLMASLVGIARRRSL